MFRPVACAEMFFGGGGGGVVGLSKNFENSLALFLSRPINIRTRSPPPPRHATRLDPDSICFDRLDPSCLYFDQVRPSKNISTQFDRRVFFDREEFRLRKNSSTEEKCFDRGVFSTEKNFDRGKTFLFFRPKKFFSTALDAGFSRLRSV